MDTNKTHNTHPRITPAQHLAELSEIYSPVEVVIFIEKTIIPFFKKLETNTIKLEYHYTPDVFHVSNPYNPSIKHKVLSNAPTKFSLIDLELRKEGYITYLSPEARFLYVSIPNKPRDLRPRDDPNYFCAAE